MHIRRRMALLGAVAVIAAVAAVLASSGGKTHSPRAGALSAAEHATGATRRSVRRVVRRPPRALVVSSPPAHATASWKAVARVNGKPAVWVAQRAGATLLRFDQALVHVDLHAGSSDGGVVGWRYGDEITSQEIHKVIAAVNGGFKLTYANVGFMAGGHVAVALKPGLASIVTYSDGTTDIGAWLAGVPSAHRAVYSVLQNQRLLVDHGAMAASVSTCILSCWGETIGNRTSVARSGLGITADGQLVWAAGEEMLPDQLAAALISAGAIRAIELDINPDWVAGYLYVHHPPAPTPEPVVPGQLGIAGKLLQPDARDFLTFVAN